jgi:CRISPR-associated protein Csh1
MEDIYPSRVVKIHDIIEDLEKKEVFEREKIKFNFLSNFFKTKDDKQPKHKEYFFKLVEAAYKDKLIDKSQLINLSMQIIRRLFINKDKNEHWAVLRVFITLLFLLRLNLIKERRREDMMKNEFYREFFEEYKEFFDSSIKRAIFLLGVLTKKLLNYQLYIRKAIPFEKQLKGLKMQKKDFKELLPKLQAKLSQYKISYKDLEKAISHYFLEAGNKWQEDEAELNFVFVLGMNLANEELFKEEKEGGGE